MKEYLEKFRNGIALHWDEKTISPKFLPIDITRPLSAGQCAPTSYVLLNDLRKKFPNRLFTLAIGEVWKDEKMVIEYHVWVVELANHPQENMIIDVTADQSQVLPERTFESIKSLSARGIKYIAYEQSKNGRFMHDKAIPRAELLQNRFSSNE